MSEGAVPYERRPGEGIAPSGATPPGEPRGRGAEGTIEGSCRPLLPLVGGQERVAQKLFSGATEAGPTRKPEAAWPTELSLRGGGE